MGSNQSSHAKKGFKSSPLKKNSVPLSVRGRKSLNKTMTGSSAPHGLMASVVSFPSEHLHEMHHMMASEELDETSALSVHSDDVHLHKDIIEEMLSESESEESDSDSDDEMEDDLWEERLSVLEDARQLKVSASHFLHPEHAVASTPGARCFFDRASAPRVVSELEADETNAILADAALLKKVAVMFQHPELAVVADDETRCGRNFYSRPAAYESSSVEEDERLRILDEARQLKESASYFVHPEAPVPSIVAARCFFDRASAPTVVSDDEAKEQSAILADAAALQQAAVMFQHPEYKVATSDATRFGRNYFSRPGAYNIVEDDLSEDDDDEMWEERSRILAEARQLKEMASYFLHPEAPVPSSAGARCYFDRASAPEVVSNDEANAVLADAVALKQAASMFLHPEAPVRSSPGARCYFDRASAPELVSDNEANAILADALALKQAASMFLHPEAPVRSSPGARCYFDRMSASKVVSDEEQRAILSDAIALKEAASMFLHPETPVPSSPGARCYFDRISAPHVAPDDDAMKDAVLADCLALKESADMFLHPEAPVPSAVGARCYFDRASAPDAVPDEDAMEQSAILADSEALKQVAGMFLHPEAPVVASDPTAFGRNYFSRPSADEFEDEDDDDKMFEERLRVLEEARQLKELANYFLHPEVPMTSSTGSRCFFDRISAPDVVLSEENAEKDSILADATALKKSAVMFQHPDAAVEKDSTAFGRNFYSRPAAYESAVDEAEKALILSDLNALKKATADFLHPERPVEVTDPTVYGRNYFNRSSAPDTESLEEAAAHSSMLEDAVLLKKSAVDYAHPEIPVVTTDAFACGRNYFSRYSAVETESMDDAQEHAQVLADALSLKKLAVDYLHPEKPVVGDGACARNFFDRPSSKLHEQMIHTFPAHDDDWGDDHHEHVDHFGMDEEMELFADLRERLAAPIEQNSSKLHATVDSDVGSNLSRSPSSVMLFGMDDSNNYD